MKNSALRDLSFSGAVMFGTVRFGLLAVAAALGGVFATPAMAEFQFGVYGGWNGSFDSDATFSRGDTDITLHGIPWQGLSFDFDGGAPYYGARGTFWLPSTPWGVMLDYTHAKVRATPDASVRTTGAYQGGPAPSRARIDDLFSRFEFTDGINLVTINAVRQFDTGAAWTPYVGIGVGVNQPHVEVTGPAFPKTFEYQIAGVAAQVLAGVDVPVTNRFSIFGEYKLSYANVDAELTGNGRLKTDVWTNHLLIGLALRLGGQ
jgi:lipid A oxidase